MIKNTKILNAFSLTEVLVTMFVIMLLIIASAPMITRKNVKNKAPHGVWECYLTAEGKHESKLTIDGQASKTQVDGGGEYCVFKPQQNAKSYTVVTIGGGGGGASGTAFSMDVASYGRPQGYQATASGDYLILLVGGGGGGSAYQGNYGAKGGGAGGIQIVTQYLNKNDYIVLEAGMGGDKGGAAGDPESETGSSEVCSGDPNASWNDACKGGDGHPSKLYVYSNNNTIEAEGGKGGGTTVGQPGAAPGHTSAQTAASGEKGGKIDYNNADLSDFINSTDKSAVAFGFGGAGIKSAAGGQGFPGVAMLVSNSHHAGGGGKRGTTAYTTLEKITDEVKVYVGQGGAGAVTEDTNGEQGENSSFGYYAIAKGGEGGKARAESSTSKTAAARGKEGAMSPYGGVLPVAGTAMGNLNGQNDMGNNDSVDIEKRGIVAASEDEYGAGGGGGSSLPRSGATGSSKDRWGKGGRGMPGYVRVEWN